ncbi:CDP-alcohol phosphatidyltransferase [Kocuria sp. UCD-OTCP]|nr:CDP-alcohol phosphatidyltransferase [Kocuria sp. UCD-OTCP]
MARLATAQKRRTAGAPAFTLLVNRPIGRLLAAWAYRAGLEPNQVTIISAFFTFTGLAVVALSPPLVWVGLAVWLSLFLGYAFDSADGQVARLQGGGTASGEWLDHVLDCIKISTLHIVVLITAVRHFELNSLLWCLIPLAYLIADNVTFFAIMLKEGLKQAAGAPAHQPDSFRWSKSILLLPTDYGVLCLAFLALGWPALFMAIYTVLALATIGRTVLALTKWFHDMRHLEVGV